MRGAVLAVIAVFLLPSVCPAQSALDFPRVMQAGDFRTTGVALVNPNPATATVTFTLFAENGTPLATTTDTLPASGQAAKLASELFPGVTAAGWMEVTSASAGLQGFWFGGDLSTFADGAEAAAKSTDLVLPLISPQSEIHVVNTGTTAVTIRMNLLGADGFDLAEPFPQRIEGKGSFRTTMAGLFSARGLNDLSLPTHMRITCGCADSSPLAATVIARDYLAAPSWAVSNGIPASTSATTVYFPHLVEGPQGGANWRSLIGLTNLSKTAANDVELTFTSESREIIRTFQYTVPANGAVRLPARDAFGLTTGFQNGWVKVTAKLPVTGYVAYADTVGRGVAVVPPQQEPDTGLLFAHIADLTPWLTGIALLNTNSEAANVEVFAMNPTGSLIGTTTFTLAAGTNAPRLLRDLIPQTQTRPSDGGFLFVRSSLPIHGIELFFSRNLQVLANVPAGRVAPGITFVPPAR